MLISHFFSISVAAHLVLSYIRRNKLALIFGQIIKELVFVLVIIKAVNVNIFNGGTIKPNAIVPLCFGRY